MIYIDGLGYVDNQVNITSPKSVDTVSNSFEDVLVKEQEKLNTVSNNMTLSEIFDEAAKTYNVSADLLKAVAYNESGFNADATSYVGAMGIMQLMPSTAEYLGVENAYDPYQNIMGGAKYLSMLQDMYNGNITMTIAAYNAGPGNVDKYGGVPPFNETQNYVSKVLGTLNGGNISVPDQNVEVSNDKMFNNIEEAAATNAQVQTNDVVSTLLSSINTSAYSAYKSSDINSIFSYSDYELLLKYFDHMMEIIASIGNDDSDKSSSGNFGLFDYQNNNRIYNKSNINLL